MCKSVYLFFPFLKEVLSRKGRAGTDFSLCGEWEDKMV